MTHDWPFWLGGLALAIVPLLHWLWIRRPLSVSGRVSAIVDSARGVQRDVPLDQAALIDALREVTLAEFGPAALQDPGIATSSSPVRAPVAAHYTFLIGLVAGGALAALVAGTWGLDPGLRGAEFARVLGQHSTWALVLGGVLVGFGTRMAGGCTSGHGLCGTSRVQRGSLLATATFFGVGIVTALLLGAAA